MYTTELNPSTVIVLIVVLRGAKLGLAPPPLILVKV